MLTVLKNTYPVHPMGDLTRGNPYRVLVACILSLRTKDEVSIPASERLFVHAETPEKMVTLPAETIEKLIYPVGFYKNKTKNILNFSTVILDQFEGKVPDTIDGLLTLTGVGRKTANLVMSLGYNQPAICVDVHVHRICRRMGYLNEKTPDDTEYALREKLPKPYWQMINTVMVLHGQQICRPISPKCGICPVEKTCSKHLE
ncbi:MAG: endonuclease III [Cyanobacteria bacterium P01_H01_bin.74]